MPPKYSIITTCKGRLEHLRRSLPSFVAQPDTEVIVVDYDCPDGTRNVVAREFPSVRVVAIDNAPGFNNSRARNLGAAIATGEWLAFIDADIIIAPDFSARLDRALGDGAFYRFREPDGIELQARGSVLVRKRDCDALQGYDEVMNDYGGEDDDFYFRLRLLGLRHDILDAELIAEVCEHSDAMRSRFYDLQSVTLNQRISGAYLLVKNTVLRQLGLGALDEPARRRLYTLIREVVANGYKTPDAPLHFTIELPEDPGFMPVISWACKRHVVFDLTPVLIPHRES